jgi:hypothetical protein
MRQTLHIFKKDARHLRWELAILLVLLAVVAYADGRGDLAPHNNLQILNLLFVLGWFFTITRVIQSEPLPGDKQFWLTRPYSWKSLLAAKLLFLLVFFTLPMIISDSVIVTAQGFSIGEHLRGLMWMQVLWWQILLPAAVLASITSTPKGVAFWAIVIVAVSVGLSSMAQGLHPLGSVEREWISTILITAVSVGTIFWQYSRRKTVAARTVFSCVLALITLEPFVVTGSAVTPQEPSSLTITVDPRLRPAKRDGLFPDGVQVEFPLLITGVPQGLTPRPELAQVRIESPAGHSIWHSNPLSNSAQSYVREDGGVFWLSVSMSNKFFEQVKGQPVHMRASLSLTLFGDQKSFDLPPGSKSIKVPDVGLCDTDVPTPYLYRCRAPFRGPQVRLSSAFGQEVYTPASSDPAELGVNPMWFSGSFYDNSRLPRQPRAAVTLVTERPFAHLRRELTLDRIRMADY